MDQYPVDTISNIDSNLQCNFLDQQTGLVYLTVAENGFIRSTESSVYTQKGQMTDKVVSITFSSVNNI